MNAHRWGIETTCTYMNSPLRAKGTVHFVFMRFGFSIALYFMGSVCTGKKGRILTIFVSF